MIEEGFFNNNISKTVIESYLAAKELSDINALILGCTHYPLIQKEVEEYYAGRVDIIDSAHIVALSVAKHFGNQEGKPGADQFYISDYTDAFEKSTQTFFGKKIQLKEERIFD